MSAEPQRLDPQALAEDAQRRAARPDASAWVSASAGSGKTKVLVDRTLALLLRGAAPGRLLCLTFTKAAAAEMANRLAERLAKWATAPEAELEEAIAPLLERAPEVEDSALARSLFARVLDEPGGMKIQTIHGFCQSVLGRFPLEAAVAPHFQVLDELSARELLVAAREESLSRAGGALEDALAEVTTHVQEQGFTALMAGLLSERGRLAELLDEPAALDALLARLRIRLGLGTSETRDSILAAACADEAIDRLGFEVVLDGLRQGTKTDLERAAKIGAWLEASVADRAAGFQDYLSAFFTKGGDGPAFKKLINKDALEAAGPGAEAILNQEAQRLYVVRERLRAEAVLRATAGLLRIGAALLARYGRHKQARALLDYDDLILRTRDLLTAAEGRAAWVLYKLDGGLEHVLIDEAQDTNPEQWQVVAAISDEFFVGEGRAESLRSVFAVGDPKQSIYGFQRADPARFNAMRAHYAARTADAGQAMEQVSLAVSFRSTAPVLALVDDVFADPEARDGLFLDGEPLVHIPSRRGQAGQVELWPPVAPEDEGAADPWSPPEAGAAGGALPAPPLRLARLIARRIWRWTRDPGTAEEPDCQLVSKGRRLEPGDIMVLVRRRNSFVEALVRELKRLEVPVAGVDRMVLSEQLAVMDLVALGHALLLPEDDLTLATVLKGPLIGLDEDQLFDLAHDRPGTLWAALGAAAGRVAGAATAHEMLAALMARADYVRPFELYAELLGAGGGRRRLVGRLGPDANDPLDEFLALALAYEREHLPSLEGFLHWFETGGQEVKRDLEQGGGAVRVMTVHGAKGLQAPLVILPDTRQLPPPERGLLWLEAEEGGEADLPLWPLGKERYDFEAAAAARERTRRAQEREHHRLLYVAMTRAEDRLYLCGWDTKKAPPAGTWYDLVERALSETGEAFEFDCRDEIEGGWAGPGWRKAGAQEAPPEETPQPALPETGAPLPDWALAPPAPEPALPRPLSPSRPDLEEPPVASPLAAAEAAGPGTEGAGPGRFRRGLLVHRLLQHLPALAPERRAAAGARYLAQPQHGLSDAEQAEVLADVLAVLEDPAARPLFAPESRAEAPVAGVLIGRDGAPVVVAGQVDRLLVTERDVLVIDYKTNRDPPADSSEVSLTYLRQMATYQAVLKDIFPGHSVRCLLLWTVGPRLMQLSDDMLRGHAP